AEHAKADATEAASQPSDAGEPASSKDDAQPQLVIALNDARLVELTKGNEDVLQGFLAMVYGDPKLKVQFQQSAQSQESEQSQENTITRKKKKKSPLNSQKQHNEL
ncbi:hypothetical protein GGI23_007890, partial [Coemansia sp. RSA 2559]